MSPYRSGDSCVISDTRARREQQGKSVSADRCQRVWPSQFFVTRLRKPSRSLSAVLSRSSWERFQGHPRCYHSLIRSFRTLLLTRRCSNVKGRLQARSLRLKHAAVIGRSKSSKRSVIAHHWHLVAYHLVLTVSWRRLIHFLPSFEVGGAQRLSPSAKQHIRLHFVSALPVSYELHAAIDSYHSEEHHHQSSPMGQFWVRIIHTVTTMCKIAWVFFTVSLPYCSVSSLHRVVYMVTTVHSRRDFEYIIWKIAPFFPHLSLSEATGKCQLRMLPHATRPYPLNWKQSQRIMG